MEKGEANQTMNIIRKLLDRFHFDFEVYSQLFSKHVHIFIFSIMWDEFGKFFYFKFELLGWCTWPNDRSLFRFEILSGGETTYDLDAAWVGGIAGDSMYVKPDEYLCRYCNSEKTYIPHELYQHTDPKSIDMRLYKLRCCQECAQRSGIDFLEECAQRSEIETK